MLARRRIILPVVLLVLLWLVLAENQLSSWVIGIPFIALALLIVPPTSDQPFSFSLRGKGLLQFLRLFAIESIRGGIDVSRRVLVAEPAISPGFFDYPLRLQGSVARKLFIASISLLPGTLTADWVENTARIHTLDDSSQSVEAIQILEQHIAALFGEIL